MESLLRTFRSIRIVCFLVPLAISGLNPSAFADGTRTWEQSKFEDLTKGAATGVAIRSSGGLELAPSFKLLYATPSTYIWAVASDEAGNVYAATGSPARVYRITPEGQATIIFEPQELQVQTLEVAPGGVIYAATAPDGKVYKIEHKPREKGDMHKADNPTSEKESPKDPSKPALDRSWSSSEYFAPGTKYIWDLLLDKTGNLYVATGDHGEIYKVTPKGEHSIFFKSDDTHIRVLALDAQGNVIAGTDGSGLVYRISPAGDGFVLYSAPKKEITALALDREGNIYAAGVGEKRANATSPASSAPTLSIGSSATSTSPQTPGMTLTLTPSTPPAGPFPFPGGGASGGSDVYRIAADGSPSRIWTSHDDIVYALAFDSHGKLLAGTGNRGHVFAIEAQDEFSDLLKSPASQVTGFAKAPGGGLYAASSNLGKIFVRYAQWKAVLHAGSVKPAVDTVTLNYLPKNVAPEIEDISVQIGVRYQPLGKSATLSLGTDLSGSSGGHFESPVPNTRDHDAMGVKWSAHDENDDQLIYSVYYRGDGETRWLLLKDNLTDKAYSFDASLLPDGGYTVKIVASDAPSHSPGEALTATKESRRFEVDTTPPRIENLTAALEGTQIQVRFRAEDGFSTIKRAEYSVDAGEWKYVEPTGQLSDAKMEAYDFKGDVEAGKDGTSEHVVVVRVYDKYDNMGAAKTVLRGK